MATGETRPMWDNKARPQGALTPAAPDHRSIYLWNKVERMQQGAKDLLEAGDSDAS